MWINLNFEAPSRTGLGRHQHGRRSLCDGPQSTWLLTRCSGSTCSRKRRSPCPCAVSVLIVKCQKLLWKIRKYWNPSVLWKSDVEGGPETFTCRKGKHYLVKYWNKIPRCCWLTESWLRKKCWSRIKIIRVSRKITLLLTFALVSSLLEYFFSCFSHTLKE